MLSKARTLSVGDTSGPFEYCNCFSLELEPRLSLRLFFHSTLKSIAAVIGFIEC